MARKNELVKDDPLSPLGVTAPPEILVECEAFSGSLAMLFQCVRQRRTDPLDVPLAPICEAYFAYLIESAGRDLDSAAVALVALSYLVERKAWALLPPHDEEPEVEDVLEIPEPYAHEFLPAIEALRSRFDERNLHFFRTKEGREYEMPFDMGDVTIGDLAFAFERILARAKPDTVQPLGRPRRSLADRMIVVLKALSSEFRPLEDVVATEFTRSEVVWWFLALLELIRLGQARVKMAAGAVLFARGVAD